MNAKDILERQQTQAADTESAESAPTPLGSREVDLDTRNFLALPDAALTIACLVGELLLIREDDCEGCVLGAGQNFTLLRGKHFVKALRPSRVRLASSALPSEEAWERLPVRGKRPPLGIPVASVAALCACPFCASEEVVPLEIDQAVWAVFCRCCKAIGPHTASQAEAVRRWAPGC